MNWKICLVVFVNLFLISFPYNIIGCGPTPDPYDNYTSFFRKDLSEAKGYQPFYYINDLLLYDENEPEDAAHATAAEWIDYCGGKSTRKEAYDFVCRYNYETLFNFYNQLEKNQPVSVPDSVGKNSITNYFRTSKDLEALGYILYAKKVEPFVTGGASSWDAPTRDSLKMSKLAKDGLQLYAAAKKDFIKLRYGYQVLRLLLYSGNATDCIRNYDLLIKNNKTNSILQQLSASLKGGALFRLRRDKEAAYVFSQQFSSSSIKRVANYQSFSWCVKRTDPTYRQSCLALCKTAAERANMLGLFALGNPEPEIKAINTIYQLAPRSTMLEILTLREANKIEERYFSPTLAKQKGGRQIFLEGYYTDDSNNSSLWLKEAKELAAACHSIAKNDAVTNKALFETTAAYLSYITKNYAAAKEYLANVSRMPATQKIKDQCALTQLLVTINEKPVIDSIAEVELLPSIQWLEGKVKAEKKSTASGYYEDWGTKGQWHQFYRNLFASVLAKSYHRQGSIYKEALCIGNGERIVEGQYDANDFLQNDMQTKDILALHKLLQSSKKTAWDQYLATKYPLSSDVVTAVIAMTHARDYNFVLAIEWLGKIKDPEVLKLERNPFADFLFDNQEDRFATDNGRFNKLRFIKDMAALKAKEKQQKALAADFYKLAVGYYNMTFYGRAWEVVKDHRPTTDGYSIPPDATPFQKEYYSCFTAEKYFRKAMEATTDKEMKARCLFMMAKCSQKRVAEPTYNINDPAAFQKATDEYFLKFKYNQYFPQLRKDYGNTAFFKEAVNTCSYLNDFIEKK
jgi:hypothetical protein